MKAHGRGWQKDLPCRQPAHYPGAGNGGVADGYDILQLCFEDGVEVLRRANRDEGV
jgi:hypothetical protein